MSQAIERLVNLALFLGARREPVTARVIQERVEGYPPGQDEEAFLRMFERDKKALRGHGMIIEARETPDGAVYALDTQATFATPVDLSAEQAARLRAVGAALVSDAGFPHREALRSALFKLAMPAVGSADARSGKASIVREDADTEGEVAGVLARAAVTRKRVAFDYRTADGQSGSRTVEPYGLFLRNARWYLVANDLERDAVRVFAARRVTAPRIEPARPGTPDFEVPAAVDVASWAKLPFQFGKEGSEATLRFDPDVAWRAPLLFEGHGELSEEADGSVTWRVLFSDPVALARWTVANGPGIRLLAPESAIGALAEGLARAVAEHG